jgi:hypothetical protein
MFLSTFFSSPFIFIRPKHILKKERRAVRGNFYLFLDDLIVGAEEKQILLTICIMYLLECVQYTIFFFFFFFFFFF